MTTSESYSARMENLVSKGILLRSYIYLSLLVSGSNFIELYISSMLAKNLEMKITCQDFQTSILGLGQMDKLNFPSKHLPVQSPS